MEPMRRMTTSELAAEHLRTGLRSGRWGEILPGVARLAQDLDVSRHTLRTALRQLETEGVLAGRGLGRSRCITATGANISSQRPLRIAILRHDLRPTDNAQTAAIIFEIIHSLESAGHTAFFSKISQLQLRHDVRRIAKEMAKTPADAWIVVAGSRPLLELCANLPIPCLALYGRSDGLPLAGAGLDRIQAFRAVTRDLIKLGHRRIVHIVRETRREPVPGAPERAILEELAAHGLTTNEYNLPKWEETPAGFYKLLENLFLYSPPTALIVDETARFIATMEFLSRRGIKVPEQVSLVFPDDDPALAWCHHGIAHLHWDPKPLIRRVVRWVDAVRKGKPDRKIINYPAEFVPGGSIGTVWKG